MTESRTGYKSWSADRTVCFWLLIWLAVNLLQAAFTGLANDEPYYWVYAKSLAWGYYDHPPMTALLVWLGNLVGGTLGIRLFFVLLQPLYLWIFWTLVRPANATRRHGELYVLICSSILMLQLYGFLAVPDAPLMMSTVLFLWAFNRFSKSDTWLNTALLGLTMALLAYSKYQGALVVLFAFCSNLRLLKRYKLWLAGLMTLVLYAPHLYWQYSNDFPSFRYHLMGRNRAFRFSFITEYLLNIAVCFNPLLLWIIYKGWNTRNTSADEPLRRALKWMAGGFLIFFLLSCFKGRTQPQWLIPICYSIVMMIYGMALGNQRVERHVRTVAVVTLCLIALTRLEMFFNPLGIKFELFDNRQTNAQIASIANSRPVLFGSRYDKTAKYMFYAGGECFSQHDLNDRTSQWEFTDYDDRMAGREVVAETDIARYPERADSIITLANGKRFGWTVIENYQPVRKVRIDCGETLLCGLTRGTTARFTLTLTNPYPYSITLGAAGKPLQLVVRPNGEERFMRYNLPVELTLRAGEQRTIENIEFAVPTDLNVGEAVAGFAIDNSPAGSTMGSRATKTEIR